MTLRRHILACSILCACLASARDGRTQTTDRELIEHGIELRRQGKDAEALQEFRRAHELRPSSRARAQVALAEQALGRWVEAERDLVEALKAVDDPWIQKNQKVLQRGLEEIAQHLGTLRVETDATGAELWMGGIFVQNLPGGPLRVPAGSVRVELRVEGRPSVRKSVDVPAGASVILHTDVPRGIAAPDAAVAGATEAPTRPDGAAPHSESLRPTLAWASLTAAGIFLSAAVASQIVRAELAAKYNGGSCDDSDGLTRSQKCGRYMGGADAAQTVATLGFALGGAAAAASTYLFLTTRRAPQSSPSQVTLSVGSRTASFGWSTAF